MRLVSIVVSGAMLISFSAVAQKSGQNVSIQVGVVQSAERVTLQSEGGGKGAVVGGALGYASGSGQSKSKKRRNALIGGAAGAALSSSGQSQGMQYGVKLGDGSAIVVVSDQTEVQVGDCVTVEQSGDRANIRRQDPAACDPDYAEVIEELEDEFEEEATVCDMAKQDILNAKTTDEVELASAKAQILCN